MAMIIIAAMDPCRITGKGDNDPWKISEDMKRFKMLTEYHPVIMRRKIYDLIIKKTQYSHF